MVNIPRPPAMASLAELVMLGYISETDVSYGGHVSDSTRLEAERRYAEFQRSRPESAPPRPYLRRQQPIPPTPRAQTARISSAHVHRIQIRRDNIGSERVPTRTALDTCCICYTNPRDHAVVPCFHMCLCKWCSQRITSCPICRGPSERIQRIYV